MFLFIFCVFFFLLKCTQNTLAVAESILTLLLQPWKQVKHIIDLLCWRCMAHFQVNHFCHVILPQFSLGPAVKGKMCSWIFISLGVRSIWKDSASRKAKRKSKGCFGGNGGKAWRYTPAGTWRRNDVVLTLMLLGPILSDLQGLKGKTRDDLKILNHTMY